MKATGFDDTSCDRSQVVRPVVVPCGSQIVSVVKGEGDDIGVDPKLYKSGKVKAENEVTITQYI